MTIEQQILWLAWYRYDDCKELFETISGDFFPNEKLGKIYELVRTRKLNYAPGEIDKIHQILNEHKIFNSENAWIPLFPEKLKEALIDEWRQVKGNEILSKAHKELNQGQNYRITLKQFDKIETEHRKKQSTLKDHFAAIAEDYHNGKTKGIPTGIPGIDKCTEQLKEGHLWVILAATNYGKTTLTLQIAKNALFQNAKVDFISLEMSARQLLERLAWIEAAQSKITFERAIGKLIDLPLTVTENLRTVEDIKSHIENSSANLIIIDYIQLIRGGKSYFDEATLAANMLQEMAIKKMLPIICLSQVTKDSYKAGVSHVIDGKNSGAIGESADVVLEIYRNKDNEPDYAPVKLFLKKNRHGRTGDYDIHFDLNKGIFVY